MKSLHPVALLAVLACAIMLSMRGVSQSNSGPPVQLDALLQRSRALMGKSFESGALKPKVSFASAVNYDSGGVDANSAAIADVNGDGKPDLLVANDCGDGNCNGFGSVGVLIGNGDGTFQSVMTYNSGGEGAYFVAVADVNGDGKPDLVVANGCGDKNCDGFGSLGVLIGNGDGTFQPVMTYSSGGYEPNSVAVADVDGDGRPDLVVSNSCADQSCDGNSPVGVLFGNGDGTFRTAVIFDSGGSYAESVVVADVNGDGKPDLVVANFNAGPRGSLGVLLNNGDGTFQPAVAYDSGGHGATSVAVADVNRDGKADLVVANVSTSIGSIIGLVAILRGNGDGTFQPALAYRSGGYESYSVAVADLNGDGSLDLVVSSFGGGPTGNGCAGVLLGYGDGTFKKATSYGTGGYSGASVTLADVNRDGKPDVIAVSLHTSGTNDNGSLGVLLNETSYNTKVALTSSANPSRAGQPVTLTAAITSSLSVPNGEIITFYNGKTTLGIGPTTNGIATLTTSFSKAGRYTIKARYPGDAFHKASSGTVKQVVNQ